MKRRILSIITALALCLSLCPAWAFAAAPPAGGESLVVDVGTLPAGTQMIYIYNNRVSLIVVDHATDIAGNEISDATTQGTAFSSLTLTGKAQGIGITVNADSEDVAVNLTFRDLDITSDDNMALAVMDGNVGIEVEGNVSLSAPQMAISVGGIATPTVSLTGPGSLTVRQTQGEERAMIQNRSSLTVDIAGDVRMEAPNGYLFDNSRQDETYPISISAKNITLSDNSGITNFPGVTLAPSGTMNVNGHTPVAKVTKDGSAASYVTLEDAYEAAAAASPATVTLLDNVALDSKIVASKGDVTLDLNGKTITGKFELNTGSSLTVRGSGAITSKANTITVNGGTLTVEGGTIEATETLTTTIGVNSLGKAVFHGGHIISQIYEDTGALAIRDGATAEIEGGTFTGGIHVYGTGTAKLRGGVFENGGSDKYPSVFANEKVVSTLLDQTGGTRYAYYRDGVPVAPGEQTSLLGAITVKKCTHEGIEFTKNEDGTHSLACPYCGASYTHDTTYTATASGNVIAVGEGCDVENCGYKKELGTVTVSIPELAYGELDKEISVDTSKLENWAGVGLQVDELGLIPVAMNTSSYPPIVTIAIRKLTSDRLLTAEEHKLHVGFVMGKDESEPVGYDLTFIVDPAVLAPASVTAENREYAKGNRAVVLKTATVGESDDALTVDFPANTTGAISGENAGTYDKVTLANGVTDKTGNYTIPAGTYQTSVNIYQAGYEGLSEVYTSAKFGATGTYDFTNLLQDIDGAVLGETSFMSGEELFDGKPTVSGNILTYKLKENAAANSTGQIGVLMKSTNYRAEQLYVTVTVTDRDVPTLAISPVTVAYTGEAVPGTAIQGTAKVGDAIVPGAWSFKDTAPVTVADSGVKVVTFTPDDTEKYAAVEGTVFVTISKATPAGTPTYTAISAGGKTLADAALTAPEGWPNGDLAWSLPVDTAVTANTQYEWTFTPEDTANYNTVTGKLTLWVQSSGGNTGKPSGGSSSGGSSTSSTPPVTTDKTTEGSVSTTETTAKPSATTKGDTASSTVSTSVGSEIVKQAEQNKSDNVVIAPEIKGNVTKTEVSIPAKTVEQIGSKTQASLTISTPVADVTIPNGGLGSLASEGGTVSVTAEVKGNAVELSVTAGGKTVESIPGGVTLTVPAENTTSGTVAVLVHPDGTREVVRKSVADGNSVTIPLDGSAKIEIVDNGKVFSDMPVDNWAADAVAFASAHELFNGTSDTTFSPDLPMSRGMLAVVLHNLESNPDAALGGAFSDVSNSKWYAEGVSWAAAKGIITGYGNGMFGPDNDITREQLAVMLWRYSGSPAATNKELHFNDADEVSGFALEAMRWAVEHGIVNGYGDGRLGPKGQATRAQVAQMLKNYLER